MKKILATVIFASLTVGLRAQCDTFILVKDWHIFDNDHLFKPFDGIDVVPSGDYPVDSNEWRRIYFIHGLGGDKSAWEQAGVACQYGAADFPARKCETTLMDYVKSTASLLSAANDVRKGIRDQANADRRDYYNLNPKMLNPARAILIAHSQGGVVSRELMHLDFVADSNNPILKPNGQMNYGGLVTVASPLQGAQILNNRDWILTWANQGCRKLMEGPVTYIDVIFVGAYLRKIFNNLIPSFCNVITNDVMPMFVKDYYKGITAGYAVGSDTINILNRDTNNANYRKFPKMAFYAVEPQDNIFWRTLNWIINSPNDTGAFQANDDWKFYNTIGKEAINKYKGNYEQHQAEYERLSKKQNTFFIGWFVSNSKVEKEYDAMVAWLNGLYWLNDVNISWKEIICAADWKHPNHHKENDGVVLAESAMGLPCPTHLPVKIYPTFPNSSNEGSSHMQVRNDEGLKVHLNKLFNGDYDFWFATAVNK